MRAGSVLRAEAEQNERKERAMEYFNQASEAVVAELESDKSRGLTAEQVKEHAARYGKNEFTKAKRKSLFARIWDPDHPHRLLPFRLLLLHTQGS